MRFDCHWIPLAFVNLCSYEFIDAKRYTSNYDINKAILIEWMSISTRSSCCERMKFVFLEERSNEKRKIILSILVDHRGKNRDNNGNTLRISISVSASSASRSRTRCLLNSTAETGRANKLIVGLLTDVKPGAIPRRLAIEVKNFWRPSGYT